MESMLQRPHNYVGFDTITTQIEHRLLKRGFQFNVMCVGHSGLGKTTLINTLFASHLVDSSGRKLAHEPIEKTSDIKVTTHDLVENNVRLKVNVIDTPGFGDQLNNEKCWEPVVKYMKDQYSQYLRKELTAQREKYILDSRVHCIIYFIQPNGKGLRTVDVEALKRLSELANVVPVIAKSDSLTLDERAAFKRILQDEFSLHQLKLYPFDDEEMLEEEKQLNQDIRSLVPFAVVGSEKDVTVNGEVVRGRRTRWGTINVEDITQCDFVYLRDFLTRTHLHDLIETTSLVHYEAFRSKQLIALKENAASSVTRVSNTHMPNSQSSNPSMYSRA